MKVQRKRISRQSLLDHWGETTWQVQGRVLDVVGHLIRAQMPQVSQGSLVEIRPQQGGSSEKWLGEVVGFDSGKVLILPYHRLEGIAPGCLVQVSKQSHRLAVGAELLGKVVDPFLQPLHGPALRPSLGRSVQPLDRHAPNPMDRERIKEPLSLGIRAIDGLLTFGRGQRIGIMAGSGVGKSVLLGMIARGSQSDVNVIGLIGERGREVKEFIESELGPEGLARSVVVAVTSDQTPLMKIRAAKAVTAIAEYFSAQGKDVLLMMDSLTRVATAQREIGLATGEPPTTKGYPPSVFTMLPRLLERCGPQSSGRGSISGLYTVLVDGDDFQDPMPDAARGILDGHIVLSRDLAQRGHFPAIDLGASTSRVMYDIVDKRHWERAKIFKALMAAHKENFDYVQLGSYQPGSNPELDEALRLFPKMEQYLRQDRADITDFKHAVQGLTATLNAPRQLEDTGAPAEQPAPGQQAGEWRGA